MADEILDEDEALLAPLRAQYKGHQLQLLTKEPRAGKVVLRSPTAAEYRAYKDARDDETTKRTATHNLLVTLLVYPPGGGDIFDRPGLAGWEDSGEVQRALGYLCGLTSKAEGKS